MGKVVPSVAGVRRAGDKGHYRDAGETGTNPEYSPKGSLGLGSWPGDDAPYKPPEDMIMFEGFGADRTDLERGYCDPGIAERPDYDKRNYVDRWTEPLHPTEEQGDTQALPKDYEFRERSRMSRGFLTRPRIPTERS